MRGGAIFPTVLAGLSNNTPYVCGSTRIDQATAEGKIEAYDVVYGAVGMAAAGGRQAAIDGVVARARAIAAAPTGENRYLAAHPNYVALYKSGGNYYTVNINKAPGTLAIPPGNAAVGAAAAPAAVPPAQRAAIAAAVGGAPGPLPIAGGGGQADYIIVQA